MWRRGPKTEPGRRLSLRVRPTGQATIRSHLDPRCRARLSGDRVSSTMRGVPSEVALDVDVTVTQERLGQRVASLNKSRMDEVCAALRFSLGCG